MRDLRKTMIKWALAVIVPTLAGCATAGQLGLLGPTDLSVLEPGMSIAEVHEIAAFGKPDERKEIGAGVMERFTYDRGYKNQTVKENPILLPFAVGTVALIDVLGVGIHDMNRCIIPCQKGHLDLYFDRCGHLIAARESRATGDGFCWDDFGKGCLVVANSAPPSSLASALKSASWNHEIMNPEHCAAEDTSP